MNDNLTKFGVVGNAIVTVGILLVLLFGGTKQVSPMGNYLQDAGNSLTSFGATFASFSSTLFSHLTNLQVNGNFNVVGISGQGADGNTGTVLQTQVVTGTCSTASSTIFSIPNPFSATSTLTHFQIFGTQGATTSDIVVATSTTAAPLGTLTSTSTLAENIMGFGRIATSTTFYSIAGAKIGPSTGYSNPAISPYSSFIPLGIGPNDFIIGFSTSSYPAAAKNLGPTATTIGAVPASCTYKAEFQS